MRPPTPEEARRLSPDPLTEASIVTQLRRAGCVFAEDEAALLVAEAPTPEVLATMVAERVAGRPLEQILGWAEFCGQRITVEPGVFVPRRRTELLVREAVAVSRLRPDPAGAGVVIVDLCCGSGAVGAALAAALSPVELHVADVDPAAVRCARRNVAAFGGQAYQGDLFEPLPAALRGRVELLMANTPYVPTGAVALMPPEARLHEPRVALDGGADGLDLARRVAAAAPQWLSPGGHVFVETSQRQAPALVAAMTQHGLTARVAVDDELDGTAVVGNWPGVHR